MDRKLTRLDGLHAARDYLHRIKRFDTLYWGNEPPWGMLDPLWNDALIDRVIEQDRAQPKSNKDD